MFKVLYTVPANPKHILLDFEGTCGTPESELKKKVFDVNCSGTFMAIVIDMSGVGKSCAFRGVGLQKNV